MTANANALFATAVCHSAKFSDLRRTKGAPRQPNRGSHPVSERMRQRHLNRSRNDPWRQFRPVDSLPGWPASPSAESGSCQPQPDKSCPLNACWYAYFCGLNQFASRAFTCECTGPRKLFSIGKYILLTYSLISDLLAVFYVISFFSTDMRRFKERKTAAALMPHYWMNRPAT